VKPWRLGVRREHGALAFGALALFACSAILGIDDRRLDPQGGEDSSVDASAETSMDVSADASTDRTLGADVSTGSEAGADGAAHDGGTPEGSSAADGSRDVASIDAVTPDAPSTDGSGTDAPGTDAASCPDPCLLATGLNHPFLMTSDANNVYWTEYGDAQGSANGTVKACSVNGCGPSGPRTIALAQTNPRGIAVDSQNVYWGTDSYGGVLGGVWSCPLGGSNCSPMRLATGDSPYGVAVDSTYVYWVNYYDYTVHRVLKGGGTDNVLLDGGAAGVGLPEQCVVDSTFVYFSDQSSDVFGVPIGGGDPITIALGAQGGGWPVANDTNYVYYGQPGSVFRASKGLPDSGVPIAGNIPDPDGLALDPAANMIYWSDYGSGSANDGTVGKVGIDGGGKIVLAASLAAPEAVTVSGSYVFWLSNGILDDAGAGTLASTGALSRRAK
jgi:hypothetical protein